MATITKSHSHQNLAQWRFTLEPKDCFFTKPEVGSPLDSTLSVYGFPLVVSILLVPCRRSSGESLILPC